MKVLVACEFSGTVREAFASRGHDAWSCDLVPSERPGNHIQDDVLKHLDEGWDLMIAHPPCTHLAVSGSRWFRKKPKKLRDKALEFFVAMLNAPAHMICVENPVGITNSRVGRCSQKIHPWQYGHENEKMTCLWLKNLPKLRPVKIVPSGERQRSPDGTRSFPRWMSAPDPVLRSRTFQGVAEAMASQWGVLPPTHTEGFGLWCPYGKIPSRRGYDK
jgi:hypothetical protein